MPPNSTLEWIAGANVPRKGRSRPRRRFIAEYETEDEDDEVEFFVKSKKRTKPAGPPAPAETAASSEPEPEKRTKSEIINKNPKKETKALKSAMKKSSPKPLPDSSDGAELSSDKEVETSGTESGSSPEDHLKEFDPECPCTNCIRAHRALKRSRLGRSKVKKRVSFSDDEEETDASDDDAETVHNFFKWNQAMEAKKARDQEAKDYKEFLAGKAKKAEDAKKATEKIEAEAKKKEEEKPKEKQGKAKDKKKAVSSGETTEASASEADSSKDETGAQTSGDESGKESGSKKKSKAKDKSTSASETSDSSKGEDTTVIAMLMEKLLKAKEKKKREKEKQREKARKVETRKKSGEKSSGHPATSFNPNWLMPPQSDVVHVEHSIETPYDPRPNAFFDNQNRVMRVYHGPHYGNPTGGLYSNPNIRASSSPQVSTQQGCAVNPNYSTYNNGEYMRNMQPSVQGYPPSRPQQMATHSSPNVNQWFQGNGTTTVPGSNGDDGNVRRSKHAPEFSYDPRILAEAEKDPGCRSPQVQDSWPSTHNNAQHVGGEKSYNHHRNTSFNPGYNSSMQSGPGNDYHIRGAQGPRVSVNGQSPSGAKAAPSSLEAQIKQDLEDLRARLARTNASMKSGASHYNSSPVNNSHKNNGASNQPSSRPRSSPNVAKQGNANSKAWHILTNGNTEPSSQSAWTAPQQDTTSPPRWDDDASNGAQNTSSGWNHGNNTNDVAQDAASNWDIDVQNDAQNTGGWGNDTTSNDNRNNHNNVQAGQRQSPRAASNGDNASMPPTTAAPGGWPSSPTDQQRLSSNDKKNGGNGWGSNADQGTSGDTAQGWADPSAAQSSGGYWENEGKDEGKAPDSSPW